MRNGLLRMRPNGKPATENMLTSTDICATTIVAFLKVPRIA